MTYNPKIYGELLLDVLPSAIDSDEEYTRIDEKFNQLITKGDQRSPEETKLFLLLADLLEQYDKRVMPEIPPLNPRELLSSLMRTNNLKQNDLVGIFSSQGIVSEVLSGKRQITIDQAKALAKKFAMNVEAFI